MSASALRFQDAGLWIHTPWDCAAAGRVQVNDDPVREPWTRTGEDQLTCQQTGWKLLVSEDTNGGYALELINTSPEPVRLDTVRFARWLPETFSAPLNTWEIRELVHGGSFWDVAAGVKGVGRKTPRLDFIATSKMFTVYQRDDGMALLLGVLPPLGAAFSEFVTLHSDPHLEGSFGFEIRHRFECRVDPGASVRTAPVIALAGRNGTELMRAYGRLWYEHLDRKPTRPPMIGWSSWDYYTGAATEPMIHDNLASGRSLFGPALEVIALDDGWQSRWGDWTANRKFGGDLTGFCRDVKARGGRPGIWTAPLLVNTSLPLFFEKPDWFARRADGQIATGSYSDGPVGYLDVTRPEVLAHLQEIFHQLRATGFEYFKVDFCHTILTAVRFHDTRIGRNELIHRAFAAIRDAIGDEAYLLSCGAPFESVVGLVDAVRSTGDIHTYWGHVLRNAGSLAARWWMQGQLWNCDPDFLVVRGPDTAEPPYGRPSVVTPLGPEAGWRAGRPFNEMEARTYALLVHLSGGDVMLSDALAQLKPAAVEMIRRVLTPREAAAVPVDLFESDQDLPQIWISRGTNDAVVGLFNWGDRPSRMEFDPATYNLDAPAVDFWTDQPVAEMPRRLPRRSSRALRFAACHG